MDRQVFYYTALTSEEKSRMQPCTKARCVIVTGDSTTLQTRNSIPLVDYDVPDHACLGKITSATPTTPTTPNTPSATSKPLNSNFDSTDTTDTETIENDTVCTVPISRSILTESERESDSSLHLRSPSQPEIQSEIQPKIEKNGIDADEKKPVVRPNDNSCIVDCIYFTQQCCECVIF
ncbi:uncharacterized protein LOC116432775 isoform X2 [Nomia melanderi]|uniref:uncharacterized protein LOC116432775 isoform X2 n=1 Tax=Nomia melanderi TaxID=2448451 RepID=UPI00130442B3|nr:uncharacterized protein LOC116432775 isoform X1 [Nomia melanderi]XP_031845972.1 uncharacterized protein LOC116432775 isoform X1 [Nomia melanderi]XP_031845973.1 uncharacterized protein LOC116432775 isoform X1 [Nomia melanderi]XP_031845974.1 uncharacterized protein LOC116432775 isoform X1 [Nomia melanderi]